MNEQEAPNRKFARHIEALKNAVDPEGKKGLAPVKPVGSIEELAQLIIAGTLESWLLVSPMVTTKEQMDAVFISMVGVAESYIRAFVDQQEQPAFATKFQQKGSNDEQTIREGE